MKLYASIAKVEPQDDGTLKVYGHASSGAVDSDGETVSPEAMKAAIPDYMKFGAVREMHQPMAAGTAIEIGVDDDDGKTNFAAHIVDPVAVKKVQTKVYKGFSIGGKVTSRDPANAKSITGLKLVEVSLVDRPANPEAVFTMYKAEDFDKPVADPEKDAIAEIAKMLNEKQILPTQILKASQAAIAPVVARKPIALGEFKKGMYSVSSFATLLSTAAYLASDAAYEAEYEGDASKVPEALRAWLATGIGIFNAMAAEESAELLAAIKQPDAPIAVIESAAAIGDVAKAGSKFSGDTKSKLADIHKAAQGICDKMDGLGYKTDDDAASAAGVTDTKAVKVDAPPVVDPPAAAPAIAKTEAPNTATTAEAAYAAELAKDAARAGTPVAKVAAAEPAAIETELAKRDAVIDALSKRLAALEAQPMPGKALLRAITKGQDVGSPDPDAIARAQESELPKDATPEQRALDGIKKAFRTGGRLISG
jgi:hypothetical protein